MFYNFKNPVLLFFSSFILLLIWIGFKILRWGGANMFFGSMLMVQAFAIVWLVLIILKSKKG